MYKQGKILKIKSTNKEKDPPHTHKINKWHSDFSNFCRYHQRVTVLILFCDKAQQLSLNLTYRHCLWITQQGNGLHCI